MKLHLPKILREDSRNSPYNQHRFRSVEVFKAQYDKQASGKPQRKVFSLGENSWLNRCQHYDAMCEAYPLLKMSLFTLAGLATAQGVFYRPAEKKAEKKKPYKVVSETEEVTYALAEEALYRVEKFTKEQKVVSKFYETVFRMAKYGGCFWEVTYEPVFSFRIPPMQEYIEPAEADAQGTIIRWRQVVHGVSTAEWTNQELILIPFLGETTATWPYAPSLLTGTETESDMLVEMERNTEKYMEKQAWPYEIAAFGDAANPVLEDDYVTASSAWKNRQPGDGFATRNIPVNIIQGGTGSAPIRELAVLCELMKKNINDAVMVPGVSQLYNATEASAKVLTAHVMTTLGQPVQWRIAEYFSDGILKPWLEASGFSRKSCPETLFESPDVHKKEEGDYWGLLVDKKIQTPQQACEHLGLEYDEEYWNMQLKREQEQFDKQLQAKQESAPNDASKGTQTSAKPEQVKGKSYQVTELFDKEPHKHD